MSFVDCQNGGLPLVTGKKGKREREKKEEKREGKGEERIIFVYMYIRMLKCFHTHPHNNKYAYNSGQILL